MSLNIARRKRTIDNALGYPFRCDLAVHYMSIRILKRREGGVGRHHRASVMVPTEYRDEAMDVLRNILRC